MKRRIWPYVVGGLAVTLGYGYYRYFVPKIGQASAAEIDAVLPAVLKERDVPDPSGEARYARMLELAGKLDYSPIQPGAVEGPPSSHNEKLLGEIEGLLKEGTLRMPYREPNAPAPFSELKDLANLIAVTARSAGKAGDARACARWVALDLRYASAVRNAGGLVIEALIVTAVEQIALRVAYVAEIRGWLDERGRDLVLSLLPATDGRSSAWAGNLRRDFQSFLLVLLRSPRTHEEEIMANFECYDPENPERPKSKFYGNLDPVETARQAGLIYKAFIEDLNRPSYQARREEKPLYAALEKDLIEPPEGGDDGSEAGWWPQLRYRMAMNASSNSLGKRLAASGPVITLHEAVARDSAHQNLIRAVFQLRMGRPVDAIDPFTGKPLSVDRKRKIVWSVGLNLKDDGGSIGRGGDNSALDLGYPYGDDSFHPNPNGPFRSEPPGMPPKP